MVASNSQDIYVKHLNGEVNILLTKVQALIISVPTFSSGTSFTSGEKQYIGNEELPINLII